MKSLAEMRARLDELEDFVAEYENINDILILLEEGFIVMDENGGLYLSGDEPCTLNVPQEKQ